MTKGHTIIKTALIPPHPKGPSASQCFKLILPHDSETPPPLCGEQPREQCSGRKAAVESSKGRPGAGWGSKKLAVRGAEFHVLFSRCIAPIFGVHAHPLMKLHDIHCIAHPKLDLSSEHLRRQDF